MKIRGARFYPGRQMRAAARDLATWPRLTFDWFPDPNGDPNVERDRWLDAFMAADNLVELTRVEAANVMASVRALRCGSDSTMRSHLRRAMNEVRHAWLAAHRGDGTAVDMHCDAALLHLDVAHAAPLVRAGQWANEARARRRAMGLETNGKPANLHDEIRRAHEMNPGISDRELARLVGCSARTVGRRRPRP